MEEPKHTQVGPAAKAKGRRRGSPLGSGWAGYAFASPWLVGFFALTLLPMIASLLLSMCRWNGINLAIAPASQKPAAQAGAATGPSATRLAATGLAASRPIGPVAPTDRRAAGPRVSDDSSIQWVGLDNYRQIVGGVVNGARGDLGIEVKTLEDEDIYLALKNTFYYSFLSVPLSLAAALLLAMLLNQKLRGISFFRTLLYMPHVIGGVATIMLWIWVFNPDFGLLNTFLRACSDQLVKIGLMAPGWEPPKWLYSPAWAKPSLILMSLWGAGGAMLIFLAALQNVPDHLYEAAKLDGAGSVAQFWHVTIPQITPAIFFNLVMGVIGSFQVFNEAYILTNGDGGPGKSLLFYVLHLYNKAFRDFEMGYASAMAWVLLVIILAMTLLIVRSARSWVYYEGDR